MKRIIVFGTFDILHYGHISFLQRARSFGDYLIVGLSTDEFVKSKNKIPYFNYDHRKQVISELRSVDEIHPCNSYKEETQLALDQKVDLIICSDEFLGMFDHLIGIIDTIYIPRTPAGEQPISTTQIKKDLKEGYND